MKMKKTKKIQTDKEIVKSNWAEDDLSNSAINETKKKKTKKILFPKTRKSTETIKNEKKNTKEPFNESSDDEDHGALLNKLREIDPEFYKVWLLFF